MPQSYHLPRLPALHGSIQYLDNLQIVLKRCQIIGRHGNLPTHCRFEIQVRVVVRRLQLGRLHPNANASDSLFPDALRPKNRRLTVFSTSSSKSFYLIENNDLFQGCRDTKFCVSAFFWH
ncbi:hypothetical protein Barb4_02164 [Bacteroidales bacterium Barb4]|nr:hypothetical protein Barb4_02164 [Bacteroidales bacterium Barb4]